MPDSGDLTHFKWWTVELIASLIVIFSYYNEFTAAREDLSGRDYWIFYSSIASTIISVFGLIACILPIERKACGLESLLVWFIAILRSVTTTVGIIGRYRVDIEQTLLTNYHLLTYNPNVYFFSLWALMASLLMVASWFEEFVNGGNEWKTSTQWTLLGAMSFFTMLSGLVLQNQVVFGSFESESDYNITRSDLVTSIGSLTLDGKVKMTNVTAMDDTTILIKDLTNEFLSSNETRPFVSGIDTASQAIFEALVGEGVLDTLSWCETTTYSCRRLNYAIGLGAFTAVLSFFMAPLKLTNQTFQTDISIILFLLWFLGLPFLTVAPGPATRAGNLFFGIYISYFLVLHIFTNSITYRESFQNTENAEDDHTETRESEIINRGDLWQVAYGKLERTNSIQPYDDDDNHSYGALFEEVENWDENLEEQLSSRTRESIRTIEQGLAASGRNGRRMTTLFRPNLMKRFSAQNVISSSVNSSLNRNGLIKPKGWKRRIRRLKLWFVLLTMAVVLTHALEGFTKKMIFRIVPWASICVSCIGLITCFRASKVAYGFQIASIIIMLGIWIYGAVVFVGSKSAHVLGYSSPEDQVKLLLDERNQRLVSDPNFFFGVWISVISSLMLVTNICRASLVTTDWLLFAIASVALLISSSEFVSTEESMTQIMEDSGTFFRTCEADYSINCEKFAFAMYLALASLCVSLPMALLSRCRCGPTWHVLASVPMVIAWGFGVPYVTFTDSRSTPAAVYFAFWGGIFLAFEIASINIIIMLRLHRKKKEEELAEQEKDDESAISWNGSESYKPNDMHMETVECESNVTSTQKEQQTDSLNSNEMIKVTSDPFLDEIQQEHKNSIEMISGDPPEQNIESVVSSIEHRSQVSKASADYLDSFEHPTSNEEKSNCNLLETSMITQHHVPVSSIDSDASSSRLHDIISVDTGDFEDCFEFDSIIFASNHTYEFQSTRSSIDDS